MTKEATKKRGDVLSDADYILSNSTRFQLVKLLLREKLQISEVMKKLGMGREKLCYHLSLLEGRGLIQREYQILLPVQDGRGIAGMFFGATEKVAQVMTGLEGYLADLRRRLCVA